MTCKHTHKDDPENATCEDCAELKTLKVLNAKIEVGIHDSGHIFFKNHKGHHDTICDRLFTTEFVEIEQLREEAIKWVKDSRERHPLTYLTHCKKLMEFFNLTDDDLKENGQ